MFSAVFPGTARCLARGRCSAKSLLEHVFEGLLSARCRATVTDTTEGRVKTVRRAEHRGPGSQTSSGHRRVVGARENTGGLSGSALPRPPVTPTVPLFFPGKCWALLLLGPHGSTVTVSARNSSALNPPPQSSQLPRAGFCCLFLLLPLVCVPATYLLTKHVAVAGHHRYSLQKGPRKQGEEWARRWGAGVKPQKDLLMEGALGELGSVETGPFFLPQVTLP